MIIIGNLTARDRVALGHTCKVFQDLVFQSKIPLRELDFSEEAFLTSPSHVEAYFENESALQYLLKLNVSGMYCPRSAASLLRTISKATNLIELNITGFKFETIKELVLFLEPLKQLKKLSCGWPTDSNNHEQHNRYLARPFGKLTHLSLTIYDSKHEWTLVETLDLCQRLEEFRLFLAYESLDSSRRHFSTQTKHPLNNIRFIACYGERADVLEPIVQNNLVRVCDRWARSEPSEPKFEFPKLHGNFYYEKDLEICNEFIEEVPMRNNLRHKQKGCWYLSQSRLLEKVVDLKDQFDRRNRCFTPNHGLCYGMCLMKIEDAKHLLKNPHHQLSYLTIYHQIDPDCDIHLIGTIYPKLTKLVLKKLKIKADMSEYFYEIPSDSEESGESMNQHHAFKKLVQNTPSLEDFTLYAEYVLPSQMTFNRNRNWDLGAIHFIGGWTALTSLWLANVPIKNGDCLIKIAEGCKNLKRIRLENLGSYQSCCYKEGLVKMLHNCVNLEDFCMQQSNVKQVHQIFETLANNPKLRRVSVKCCGKKRKQAHLIPAIEKLVRSCELVLLVCEMKQFNREIADALESTLEGLKKELNNRHNFEF